jgi:uncharacterized membrane protein YfhO
MLILAESFHPGWIAQIDDEQARIIRANADFIGLVVPAGEHRVDFRFAPQSLRLGAWLSVTGLFATFAVSVALIRLPGIGGLAKVLRFRMRRLLQFAITSR